MLVYRLDIWHPPLTSVAMLIAQLTRLGNRIDWWRVRLGGLNIELERADCRGCPQRLKSVHRGDAHEIGLTGFDRIAQPRRLEPVVAGIPATQRGIGGLTLRRIERGKTRERRGLSTSHTKRDS